jgi:hypothetical protein
MKLTLIAAAHHRNGVGGAPFDVAIFKETGRTASRKLAILFDAPGHCAVLDIDLLAAGDIAFASNSWRGDDYEPHLRRALEHHRESGQEAGTGDEASIPHRVEKCDAALRRYSDDGVFTGLIDLLADAMHWCAAAGEDFHYAMCVAGRHYVAELNDQPIAERKRP